MVWIFPITAALGAILGGWTLLLVPLAAFVIVPVLDGVLGRDAWRPTRQQMLDLEHKVSFRYILVVYAVLQTAMLVISLLQWHSLQLWEQAALILSVGIATGGMGITIAHEFVHRAERAERAVGYALLAQVWYMHFAAEHVLGHHKNVGLPEDPASARRNESIYRFLPRCIIGSWRHAWTMEVARLSRKGLTPWTIHNRMLRWLLIPAAWTAGVVVILGIGVLPFILGQAAMAILLLELVNYVEHYGLERVEIAPGVRERVLPKHSWESRYVVSNYLLVKLQRHSDHHVAPQRRYQALGLHDDSPQLPGGYPVMLLASLIPPLYRRLTHPIIDRMPR
jgi:alkane 1-monooxygenase